MLSKLNKGEMKIMEIMKMKSMIPKIKAIEDVKHKTIEVVPKENFEILENLTNKSVEFYQFFNRRFPKNTETEKTARIHISNYHNHLLNTGLNLNNPRQNSFVKDENKRKTELSLGRLKKSSKKIFVTADA